MRSNRLLLVILVAALLPRLAWVAIRWHAAGAELEFDDERLHWQLATNLATHAALVSDDGRFVARMPLYPAFLACFAWAGEGGVLAARLAQALLGAAAAAIAARLARDAFGSRAAWVAGVLVAFDPYSIYFANLLLSEVPFIFVSLALVDSAWRVAAAAGRDDRPSTGSRPLDEAPTSGRAAGTSGDWGLAWWSAAAVFTRPSAAGWIGVLWVILWLMDRDRWRATDRLLRCAMVLALCFLPWGLRNVAVVGDYAWLSANGGVTLYDAQGPQARGDSDQSFLRDMPFLADLGEVERDRLLARWATQEMKRDKLRVLSLAWAKLARTWSLIPNVPGHRAGPTAWVSAGFTVIVMVLAVIGTWRIAGAGRSPPPGHPAPSPPAAARPASSGARRLCGLIWLPVIYFTLLHCIYIGSLRYRVPLMPLLATVAAAAVNGAGRVEKLRGVITPRTESRW